MKKWFGLILVAFFFRLIALNQSLWLDEAVVANAVSNLGLLDLITKFAPTDFHPPLYYLLMKVWTTLFGTSEIALRLPSVIFSLGTGALLYSLGGFWPAAFILFNPLFVYYSQEARMYALVTFLLTASYLALVRKKYLALGILIVLALWSFYGAIFFVASLGVVLLFQKRYREFAWVLGASLLALILVSPLLYQQYLHSVALREVVINWSAVLGPASLKNLLLIPLKFASGRLSFEPKIVYYLLSGSFAFLVWGFAAYVALIQRKLRFLAWLIVLPITLGLVASLFTPLLSYFRFLYLLPFFALLLAQSTKSNLAKAFILAGFVGFSLVYLLLPQFQREDWKALSSKIPPKAQIVGIPSSLEGLRYYQPQAKIADIRQGRFDSKVVWVVPYTFSIYGILEAELLKSNGYHLTQEYSFRELTLSQWTK